MASEPPRPRLPIGISDFRKLREPGIIYVDKSDFVTQVLASGAQVVLLPRPRRFGKTVNLSTVRCFVEKSDEDRSALFEGLKVWGSAEARQHFQRYPVIWLTFKDVKAGRFEEAFAAIRVEIQRAHEAHTYLLDRGRLRPEEAEAFQKILRGEGPVQLYASSLLELSKQLAEHHGQGAFILIDEYDTPIHAATTPEDERKLLDFFRVFFSAGLKDNPHLFKGVLTGILRIERDSLLLSLNNVVVYSLIRSEYATCFGFTEAEVKGLAARVGAEDALPDIEAWYNGYRFGGQVIYNPWSVINFLASEDRVPRPYWVHTSSDDLLRRIILAHGIGQDGELETLLQGGEIRKIIDDRVALRDLDRTPETVWSLLLFTGYLKAVEVRQEDTQTVAVLSIPNREVLSVYRTIFRAWLEERVGGPRQVDRLLAALLAGDAETCEEILYQLLQSFSALDVAGRVGARRAMAGFDPEAEVVLTPEQVYHVFVVSVLLGLQPKFTVRSNRESGLGRYDVMIVPRTPGQPGVVLELKVRNRRKRESMTSAMTSALAQLRDRDYAAELRAAGADPIHEMGIVFDGRDVRVKAVSPAKAKAKPKKPRRR